MARRVAELYRERLSGSRFFDPFGLAQFYDDAWGEDGSSGPRHGGLGRVTVPACDIEETDEHYHISVDMPGVLRESLDVTMAGGLLTVSGDRRAERPGMGRAHCQERGKGKFQRTFSLPPGIDLENIAANYSHGVLEIEIPKDESVRPRRVEVKDGEREPITHLPVGGSDDASGKAA